MKLPSVVTVSSIVLETNSPIGPSWALSSSNDSSSRRCSRNSCDDVTVVSPTSIALFLPTARTSTSVVLLLHFEMAGWVSKPKPDETCDCDRRPRCLVDNGDMLVPTREIFVDVDAAAATTKAVDNNRNSFIRPTTIVCEHGGPASQLPANATHAPPPHRKIPDEGSPLPAYLFPGSLNASRCS